MTDADSLLEVRDLTVEYSRGRRRPPLKAVDGVSFTLAARETVGLVGESGSGKTTIGRAILGLAPIAAGSIRFAGNDITTAAQRRRRELSADLQVVFQDPYSSLNPTRTIGQTLTEVLLVHNKLSKNETRERVRVMLGRVGLPPDAADRYPAHFSGGQR
jgi:peptide/nickel transport system ATP-binding protein